MAARSITLTTDFGDRTGYVGMMHGAIYQRCRDVRVIDLTHAITPGLVREAAFVLGQAYRHFEPGTIHVGVVDPGVGTTRRAIVLDVPGVGQFVGPDNGIFSYVVVEQPDASAREISNAKFMSAAPSHTFHGRDIFAPVAGCLAAGARLDDVGPDVAVDALVILTELFPDWKFIDIGARVMRGEIVHVDRFGNLITNISRSRFAGLSPADVGRLAIRSASLAVHGLARTYGEHPRGALIALLGSGGFLEIARVGGRAAGDVAADAALLGVPVTVELPAE